MVRLDRRTVFLVVATVGQDHFLPAPLFCQGGTDTRLSRAAGPPADLRVGGHGGHIAVGPFHDFPSSLLFAGKLLQQSRFALPIGEALRGDQLVDVTSQAAIQRSQAVSLTEAAALPPTRTFLSHPEPDALLSASAFLDHLGFNPEVTQAIEEAGAIGGHADSRVHSRRDPHPWKLVGRDPLALSPAKVGPRERGLPLVVRRDRDWCQAHSVGRGGCGAWDHVVVVFFSRARLPPSVGTRFSRM